MSHFTTIETRIHDLDALRSACAELGVGTAENAVARGYGGQRRTGRLVLKLKGPYDVAVNPAGDGSGFILETDLWQGRVEGELGPGLGRLRQLYAVHKASAEARKRGLRVRRSVLPDGRIRLGIAAP